MMTSQQCIILTRAHYDWHQTTPPLGIGYLASYVRHQQTDATVKIVDGHLLEMQTDALVDRIMVESPDLVGISCLTADYVHVVKLSQMLKAAGARVAIGGVHPTFLPAQTLEDTRADYVICGEGELALARLVQGDDAIPGVYTRETVPDAGEPPSFAEHVAELDELPFPAWDMMPPASYPFAAHGGVTRGWPVGVIMTSRGCPYNCSFCASPQIYRRRVRFRSPGNVIEEIRMLVDSYGVREIQFEDDNLTLNRTHVEAICSGLIDAGIRVPWSCPNGIRADRVDRDTLRLMRAAGCYHVAFGIESADQTILQLVDKNESIERVEQAIDDAESVGISTQGFFIFGLPGETRESMQATMDWAMSSRLTRAQFLVLDVLPGSRLWNELSGEFTPNWHKSSYVEPEWLPSGLTGHDLMRMQTRAMRRFYSNPRRFWNVVRLFRFRQVRHVLKRLRAFRIFSGGPRRD